MKALKTNRAFRFVTYENRRYAISVSSSDKDETTLGTEIEPLDGQEQKESCFQTLTSLGRNMDFFSDEDVVSTACDTIFELIKGYDRGMVYRFNDDNSGEVIHEIKRENLTSSYLGLRFPATDIPLPARQLYIKNGLRYIHDVEAHDVPILDICGNQDGIDLSNCRMRS
ncbi:MAG: hypothetical protein SGARI_007239, partial [Bacillariaceae sp.]